MARAILCALFSLLSAIYSGCVIENHKNVKMLLKTIENSEKDRIYSYSTSTCRNCYRNFLGFFVHVFTLFPFRTIGNLLKMIPNIYCQPL